MYLYMDTRTSGISIGYIAVIESACAKLREVRIIMRLTEKAARQIEQNASMYSSAARV